MAFDLPEKRKCCAVIRVLPDLSRAAIIVFDEFRVGSERFFTDDVFARFKCGNGQWGVIVVGGANIDDVDIGIFEQVFRIGG